MYFLVHLGNEATLKGPNVVESIANFETLRLFYDQKMEYIGKEDSNFLDPRFGCFPGP